MMSTSFLRLVALIMAIVMFSTGCAIQRAELDYQSQVSRAKLASSDAARFQTAMAKDGPLICHDGELCSQLGDNALIKKVSHGEARAARWVLFGLIVLFIVFIDVLLLPGYHRGRGRRRVFPVTRTVVVWCEH